MINLRNALYSLSLLLGLAGLTSCQTNDDAVETASIVVDSTTIARHLEELASDKYLGRLPGGPTEELTINYLRETFAGLGLQPGNGDSYFQEVPLVEISGYGHENLKLKGAKGTLELEYLKDFVAFTQQTEEEISLEDSELVFCGFGIVAPEYGWNDYAGVDMKGKTAVVFVNDPGYYGEDSTFFKGSTMTYYGRWTYKYEEAARQGADGCIIVHETGAAAYPWFVVQNSGSGPKLHLDIAEGGAPTCKLEGWITLTGATELFKHSAIDARNLLEKARTPGFKPMPLGLTASTAFKNKLHRKTSNNVVAVLPGTDLADEYVVYTSHWDHLGIGRVIDGDSIYNGALDNASGTAAMLSIAEAFTQSPAPPRRSIVFLAVTAEEQGLLGSAYYAEKPIFPLEKTVANLNIDGVNPVGEMKDLTITGYGQSEMDDLAAEAAKAQGRYILPDQEPEKGYFFRSDQFNFAKKGVPVLYAQGGYDHAMLGKEYALEKQQEYVSKNYHRPSDEYTDDWILSGAWQDAQLYFNVGDRLAREAIYPDWKEGSEFANVRALKN